MVGKGIGILLCGMAACAGGCSGPPTKIFRVTSYPPGATIYVDGRPRGQTDMDKLSVEFEKPRATIRLEKEGFGATGAVVGLMSPEEQAFFLQEAPANKAIIDLLTRISRTLEDIKDQGGAARAPGRTQP